MRKIYFFDFDGTLTTKDTMFMFLSHCDKKRFAWQFILHIPLFLLLKFKLLKAERVKRHFIASVLKGKSKVFLEEQAQLFFNDNYPALIRENAMEFINNIEKNSTVSYIVTASLDIWVTPFAEQFGMKLLATQAQYKNGIFTGKFAGPNCNNDEKVVRIKNILKDEIFDKSISFGDTAGDTAMLKFTDEGHYKFFH